MKNNLKTIGKQPVLTRLILANACNEEVKEALTPYRFDDDRFDEGNTLLEKTSASISNKEEAHCNRKKAVKHFQDAALKTKRCFWRHALIAKHVLTPVMVHDLKLEGRRKVSFTGWFAEAGFFYNALLRPDSEHMRQRLERVGVTRTHLENGKQMLADLQVLFNEKANQKGIAKAATVKKDDALKQLAKWNKEFIFFAKLAFEENPQHLVRFGCEPAVSEIVEPLHIVLSESGEAIEKNEAVNEKDYLQWPGTPWSPIIPVENEKRLMDNATMAERSYWVWPEVRAG